MTYFQTAESDQAVINFQETSSQKNMLNQSPVIQSAKIQNVETGQDK